jgi:hypothetical protein
VLSANVSSSPFLSALRASNAIAELRPRPYGHGYFITALRAWNHPTIKSAGKVIGEASARNVMNLELED